MPRKLPKCLEQVEFLPNVSVYVVLKGAIALTGTLIAEIEDRHHDEPPVCPPPKIEVKVPPSEPKIEVKVPPSEPKIEVKVPPSEPKIEVNPKIDVKVPESKVDVDVKVDEEPEFILIQLTSNLVVPLGFAEAVTGSASTTITTNPVPTSFSATVTPTHTITFASGTIIAINIGEILLLGTNATIV
ncbi:MAG: hypothetical protein H6Q73_3050 [Firmicutes bacterium]|nr:hypothetical protein [Bacillota bacterium]